MGNIQFTSMSTLSIALAIAVLTIVVAGVRRVALPRASRLLLACGMLLLAAACGTPHYRGHRAPSIAVMVDLSPSTRGAAYHDRDLLQRRINALLGSREFKVIDISGSDLATAAASHPADAIVLFSDVQFDLPDHLPATFAAVDANLEQPSDAAVSRLSIDGDEVTIAFRNHSPDTPRQLEVDGVQSSPSLPLGQPLASGSFTLRATRAPRREAIIARIIGEGDLWPENDELSLAAPATDQLARWWISPDREPPDSSWRAIQPEALPGESDAYLSPAIIALDSILADDIPPMAQHRLEQYVRELGGALIISGGDRAFGAGGYFDSPLESLSPLSSAPPEPMRHWILLIDASGSMAGEKWQHALSAAYLAIRSLPPNDLLTVGSFARDVRWWSESQTVQATQKLNWPPSDVTPNGPTNLQPALQQIAMGEREHPSELLILSDADAKIENIDDIIQKLRDAKTHVNLLATGPTVNDDNPIAQIVHATGGQVMREAQPREWSTRARELLRATMSDRVQRGSATITFDAQVQLPSRATSVWNRTWPKSGVTPIARMGQTVAGAQWNVGNGRVMSLAFPAAAAEVSALTGQFEARPRDPRFAIRLHAGADLRISIDAIDANQNYLNDLAPTLVLSDHGKMRFAQSAPGRYELAVPPSLTTRLATIEINGRVIDRLVLGDRYSREFDAIGNDRRAMDELARRTGGRVIEPGDSRPLDIIGPLRRIDLTSECAFAGAAMIALGLIHWRRAA